MEKDESTVDFDFSTWKGFCRAASPAVVRSRSYTLLLHVQTDRGMPAAPLTKVYWGRLIFFPWPLIDVVTVSSSSIRSSRDGLYTTFLNEYIKHTYKIAGPMRYGCPSCERVNYMKKVNYYFSFTGVQYSSLVSLLLVSVAVCLGWFWPVSFFCAPGTLTLRLIVRVFVCWRVCQYWKRTNKKKKCWVKTV